MNALSKSLALFGASTIAALAAGCGGTSTGDATTLTSALTEAEGELTGAEDSLAAAKAEAEACFAEHRACESAEGADHAACRTALEACLPEDAPTPGRCGPHRGPRGVRGDGGALDGTRPPPPEDEEGSIEDGDRPPPPPPGDEAGDGDVRPPRPEGERHRCAPPPIPRERLGACRDEASAAVRSSADGEAASGRHARCVEAAFGARLDELCAKASELCKDPAAPADICARVTEACAARSANE